MGQVKNIEEDLLYRDLSRIPKVSWESLSSNERCRIKNFIKSTSSLEKTIGPSDMKYVQGYLYDSIFFYG